MISLLPMSLTSAVSADGSTIVGNGARRWTVANGIETLPPLAGLDPSPTTLPSALGLSSDGRWAVGRQGFTTLEARSLPIGLIWDGLSLPQVLDTHNAEWGSSGLDVTLEGTVVGQIYVNSSDVSDRVAGYWTAATGMIPLQDLLATQYDLADELAGWKLTVAHDITDDGRFIVGSAIDPSGSNAAFLVDLGVAVPEPGAVLLLAGGLFTMVALRLRGVGKGSHLALLFGAICLTAYSRSAEAAEFVPLDIDLSGAGVVTWKGISVTEDGSTIVASTTDTKELVRWTVEGGYEVLATEVRIGAVISGDGTRIAGGYQRGGDGTGDTPFVIFNDVLTDLPLPEDAVWGFPKGISQDGTTIVGTSYLGGSSGHATRWVDGLVTKLPLNGAMVTSADGSKIVGSNSGPYLWTEAFGPEAYPLHEEEELSPMVSTSAVGLSSDGNWTVGRVIYFPSNSEHPPLGLLWDGLTSPRVLDTNDPAWGAAGIDVTPDGGTVVGVIYTDGDDLRERLAGYWTNATGMIPLQDLLATQYDLADELAGWKLTHAYDITDDGRFIVGSAIDPSGNNAAFLVDLGVAVPEPGAVLMLAGGLFTMVALRLRGVGRGSHLALLLGAICLAAYPRSAEAAEFVPLDIDLSGAGVVTWKGISVTEDGSTTDAREFSRNSKTRAIDGELLANR
ncbi:hypothetical protein [Aeoliella mucimassa]|nr:hypothetical protein [Aeoliella mucimassa]